MAAGIKYISNSTAAKYPLNLNSDTVKEKGNLAIQNTNVG